MGALAFYGSPAFAVPVTPPGEEAGLIEGAPLPEGVYFINIFGSGGDYLPLTDDTKSNLTFTVPVIAWATPWQPNFLGYTGRFEVVVAAPVIGNVGVPYCGPTPTTTSRIPGPAFPCGTAGNLGVPPTLGGQDITAMYNPFFEAGFAWDLGHGWGFASFNGGYGPVDNELREFGNDIWVYNNRSHLSWTGDLGESMKDGSSVKGAFDVESVYGITGKPLNGGDKTRPDYWNLNLTGYVTLGKWDVGVVGFYTTDTESIAFNGATAQCSPLPNANLKCEQSRAAVGPMVQYDFPGISVHASYTFDVYDENYRNINGTTMRIDQFWLKTTIPLWTAPKLEAPLK
ncbi:MAG: transporter [Rhodomicrobium sp.]